MSALLFKPECNKVEFVPYPRTLEQHQKYVGGMIQILPTKRNTYPFVLYADEEGLLKWQATRNFNVMETFGNVLYDMPVGNVLVVKEDDDEGDMVGATEEELRAFMLRMRSAK
jgi:hypothetical protein